MRFLIYLSMIFWLTLTAVSIVDLGAIARLFAKMHLG
jgi:hypothetical protein